MALVPAGCFMMGSQIGGSSQQPVHQVCFEEPFWIDAYEVTNQQFREFSGQAGSESRFSDSFMPRDSITWAEADAFCRSRGARLPTEAEWEYAARGPDGLLYPWGNEFIAENTVFSGSSKNQTASVGSFTGGQSWVATYDQIGNVWEWVADWYDENYYASSPDINPQGPTNSPTGRRVLRGGSWINVSGSVDAATRNGYEPGNSNDGVGFRCAITY